MAPRGRSKRGRGRGRSRWGGYRGPHKKPEAEENNQSTSLVNESMIEEEEEEEIIDESIRNDTSQSDNVDTIDEKPEETIPKKAPGKRGRKRKIDLPVPEITTPPSESPRRGIIASGGSLRRRDTLKSTSRYSPPPVITRKQKLDKDKSASGENKKYVYPDTNDDTLVTRRRYQTGIKSPDANAGTKIKSETREKASAISMPDGFDQNQTKAETSRKVAETPVEAVEQKATKESEKTSNSEVAITPTNKNNDDKIVDENRSIVGRVLRRKSTEANTNSVTSADKLKSPVRIVADKATPPRVSASESPVKTTVSNNTSVTQSDTRVVTISTNTTSIGATKMSTSTTSFSTPTIPTAKLPIILKTPITNSSVLSKVPRKPSSLNKYLETLPEILDCIHHDGIPDADLEKMPDKILLVNSELPLHLSVSIDNENENYLFRQIISPVHSTRFVCLLCKGIDVAFGTKEEKDIILHYQSLHELDVEIGQAKFSQDVVYICLPKMVLNQFHNNTNLSLNSPCQYCDVRLSDIDEMKAHYSQEHQKSVIMMEQEEILQMHHFFYCSKCKAKSSDFDTHHKHMKREHNLKTYRCKSCVLVTKDENRLRTHFKAKHMLHNAGQNYQCFYCHGLLIGVERLQKHIQQSHMVQTGPSEFSCMACRKSCGKGKELLVHGQNCSLAGIKPEKSEVRFVPILEHQEELTEDERVCYFCKVKLESEEAYQLHLHHEHKIWIPSSESHAAAAATNVDKTESIEDEESADKSKLLTIEDAISDEDLERAKIKTYVGHWCRICDQMVKVYQLFYLHMVNYHKYEKVYQCVITSCKKQFKEFPEFMQHIEESGHLQKTIISHPDEVFVCSYCDLYFPNDEDLIAHLITDQHINKFTASGHFHRTEPRNFKCKACHTFFGMKESYIHHLETESHQYVCPYCGITTATPSSRRAHIQNSHAHKLLLCEDCGESHEDIMAHFVLHGYSFECKNCIKKFYNRERLNAHMEVHQEAIECNWPDCSLEKPIATRSMLVTHYRGHKSEHKCAECGLAFWNFSMLTSHQRSHQPMPRLPQPPHKINHHKATLQYANQKHPAVLKPRQSTQPMLANSVIKCGHCSHLFRTTTELDAHNCIAKSTLNNGDRSKLLELASKATGQKPSKPPTRRRASPKKQVHQGVNPSSEAVQYANNISETGDEDTQLIMILNQTTGELMEITAPKNMEVQDVIRSLDFTPAIEDVQMEAIEQHQQAPTQQTVTMEIAPEQEVQESILVDKGKEEDVVQDETEVAIEMMEQQIQNETLADDVVTSTDVVVTETVVDPVAATTVVTDSETIVNTPSIDTGSAPTEVAIPGNDGEQITQILEHDDSSSQEHAIVLPPNCLNADGSLTLDAETLQRLNLAISMDENGTITTQDGNATFIIDTSS